jgi:ribosomal protein S17E
MGKIKSKLVKRTAEELVKQGVNFTTDFQKNKEILGNTMPSKKVRNQIAGYLVRKTRVEEEKKKMLQA